MNSFAFGSVGEFIVPNNTDFRWRQRNACQLHLSQYSQLLENWANLEMSKINVRQRQTIKASTQKLIVARLMARARTPSVRGRIICWYLGITENSERVCYVQAGSALESKQYIVTLPFLAWLWSVNSSQILSSHARRNDIAKSVHKNPKNKQKAKNDNWRKRLLIKWRTCRSWCSEISDIFCRSLSLYLSFPFFIVSSASRPKRDLHVNDYVRAVNLNRSDRWWWMEAKIWIRRAQKRSFASIWLRDYVTLAGLVRSNEIRKTRSSRTVAEHTHKVDQVALSLEPYSQHTLFAQIWWQMIICWN